MQIMRQHWQIDRQGKIVWLYFDKKNSHTNSIDKNVLTELAALLDEIEKDKTIQGLIIASHKVNFIVGADILTLCCLKTPEEIMDFIQQGQLVFARLAALKISTLALIK